jgi:hypothetical protein
MGFFDSLFGSKRRTNIEVIPDRIWMTSDAKLAGIAREAAERTESQTVAILLVAHFADVLAQLEPLASQRILGPPCKAVLARDLDSELAASMNLDASATIDLIVGQRHPLPSVDDRLVEFADKLPCRCRISYHLSLDDPVMEIFAGEWVQSVLRKLGMSEDEAIQSRMVTRRIRQAQQKIEGKVIGTVDAQSAAEWLEKNFPELIR